MFSESREEELEWDPVCDEQTLHGSEKRWCKLFPPQKRRKRTFNHDSCCPQEPCAPHVLLSSPSNLSILSTNSSLSSSSTTSTSCKEVCTMYSTTEPVSLPQKSSRHSLSTASTITPHISPSSSSSSLSSSAPSLRPGSGHPTCHQHTSSHPPFNLVPSVCLLLWVSLFGPFASGEGVSTSVVPPSSNSFVMHPEELHYDTPDLNTGPSNSRTLRSASSVGRPLSLMPEASGEDSSPQTPHFVVTLKVCNQPNTFVHKLEATGFNLTFTLVEAEEVDFLKILDDELILSTRVPRNESIVTIHVQHNIPPSLPTLSTPDTYSYDYSNQYPPPTLAPPLPLENQLHFRLLFDDSYCFIPDKRTLIVIVTLSVVCLVLLMGLVLTLILLRRHKPDLFSLKGVQSEGNLTRNSSQVSPGSNSETKLAKGSNTSPIRHQPNGLHMQGSRSSLVVPSSAKPRKSSLKPARPASDIPEVCITPHSPIPSIRGSSAESPTSTPQPPERPVSDTGFYANDAYSDVSDGDPDNSPTEGGSGSRARANSDSSAGVSNPLSREEKRKSVVTFNETTQIIQIGKGWKNKRHA